VDVAHLLIAFVVLVACCALAMVYFRQSGVAVPPWLTQVLGIVVAAVVVIYAIRFLLTL
jgi:hypothetical protein